MKTGKDIQPPRWATRFLSWYCKPELLEDLQGDLHEYFDRHVKDKGERRAKLIYIVDVFKFIRPYTITKPSFINLLIQWFMINSYVKTSGRSLLRNKLFSTINIAGLAVSMSVGLLMIAFLSDLISYDHFNTKGDRIYRVIDRYSRQDGEMKGLASTSVALGRRLKESVSSIEEVTLFRPDFAGDARYADKIVPVQGIWADNSLLNVFTFPLLEGNAATALKDPYSIVLTEKAAHKIFGDGKAMGATLRFDTIDYVVTGIMKDIPEFSHVKFEVAVSFATRDILEKNNDWFYKWESIWQNYVYILLPEGTDPATLTPSLNRLADEANKELDHMTIAFELQPLYDIVLGPDLSNSIGASMPSVVIWILGALAFIVLLCASFNYTNLSIARSLRRSREVGIRKVVGAQRGHVLVQFVFESVIISLLALVFSFGLFLVLRPGFLGLAPELQSLVSLELSPMVVLWFIVLAVLTGILSGILPALFFSRINAVQVLKDATSLKVFRHVNMRKALIVVQYTFSLIFIATTLIGYRQYKHFLAFDLGFNTANILNIHLQGNKSQQLIKELAEVPEIEGISKSVVVTSVGSIYGTEMKYNDPQDSSGVAYNVVDENYLPIHGHKFIAGRNFRAQQANGAETEVIINEQVMKRFQIGNGDAQKAIGEIIKVDKKELQIVGVLRDFHYDKVDHPIEPFIFRYSNQEQNFVNAKIVSTDLPATMDKIDAIWKKVDRVHPIDAKFYSQQIERAYNQFVVMVQVIGFLAFLAVSIASMGLFGMVVFTTETRQREMGIRKVLGANESNLIYLLSRGFLILLLIASAIALPLTYIFFDQVVLTNFTYHDDLGVTELFWSLAAVLVIALVMIGSQTLKVARTNPATVLKCE